MPGLLWRATQSSPFLSRIWALSVMSVFQALPFHSTFFPDPAAPIPKQSTHLLVGSEFFYHAPPLLWNKQELLH